MQFFVIPDIDQEVVDDVLPEEEDDEDEETRLSEKRRIAQLLADAIGDPSFNVDTAVSAMSSTSTSLLIKRRSGPKKRAIRVDAQEKSVLTMSLYKGRYFIYLMSHSVQSKIDSCVGYTTNPLVELFCHNNRMRSDRNTCMAAPHWMLDIVLGPFPSKEHAIACGQNWVSRTRGKDSKREKAVFLASLYNVDMYSFTEKPKEPIRDMLERHTSREFVTLFDDMSRDYGLAPVSAQAIVC